VGWASPGSSAHVRHYGYRGSYPNTSQAFLKRKQEALTTTTPRDLMDAMASMPFTIASPSIEPQRSIANTTATKPWSSSRIIIDSDNDYTDIEPRLVMLIGAPNLGVRAGHTMLLVGAILSQGICILVNTGASHLSLTPTPLTPSALLSAISPLPYSLVVAWS
jgi:hypothetical protein